MSFKRTTRAASAMAIALAVGTGGAIAAQKQARPAPAVEAQAESAKTSGYGVKLGGYFTEEHKLVARRYFAQYAKGKDCPEGMQRAGKACKSPVDGRYWAVGQPLQKAVETYRLPEQLVAQLPPPPAGYEYVRANDDILLVSKGMHLVMDMIQGVMG